MNILIVEDEKPAAQKMQFLINKILPDANVVGIGKSVTESLEIIQDNDIALGFFDIQIEDGLSFSIFDNDAIDFPVIFTTAFNEYAIQAFKYNSIDYLLKPISEKDLQHAIQKFQKSNTKAESIITKSILDEVKQLLSGNYKERFMIKTGAKIKIINSADICFFYSENKASYAKTIDDKDNLLDQSLENIFPVLNPKQFFKVSRKHIVNINHINDIYAYSNSRLVVNTKVNHDDDIIVSREKVKAFKEWIEDVG